MDNEINSVLTDKRDCLTVIAKQWFDKVNGNSYFSARVYINNIEVFKIPFQYGYGDFYMQPTEEQLREKGLLTEKYIYEQYNVLKTKQSGCLKKDVIDWGFTK